MDNKILRKLQLIELEILDEVIRICASNDIQYVVIAGTLIGTVRHKGFIPWDDDIDIAMPRLDYEKFKSICATELDCKYSLIDWETENLYHLTNAKIKKNNTIFELPDIENINVHKGIFVDIFILDDAKKHRSILQGLQCSGFNLLRGLLWAKVVISSYKNKSLRDKMNQFFVAIFSVKGIKKLLKKTMTMFSDVDSQYYINFDNEYSYKEQAIAKNKFFPSSEMEFEGRLVMVPNDWDYLLTSLYGEYMVFPPVDERIPKHGALRIAFDIDENI